MMLPANMLTALDVRDAIAARELSCVEVATACLARIAAREADIHAWAWCDPDRALAAARLLDASEIRGPLHGVPFGVKDVIDTADMPTGMGSPIYDGYRPPADASCVALLRVAGALVLGKTVTCEFAGVAPGPTTNPHDPGRTPGGSSSGSAAAVADWMVPLALGTQTGGSVQRPASYCGIVGLKPSFGLVNPAGVKPAAESLDTVGLLTRTVEDAALALEVLTGGAPMAFDPAPRRLSVGLCRTPWWNTAEQATRDAVLDAGRRIEAAGHVVREVELPADHAALPRTREIINDFERARGLAHEWHTHRASISAGLAGSIRRGFAIDPEAYVAALDHVAGCRATFGALLAPFDLLLAPAVSGEAERGLSNTGAHQFQSIWTQLRMPTLTLPTAAGPAGMPVSIQLVGRMYGDRALLAAGKLLFDLLGRGPVVGPERSHGEDR